MLLEITQPKSTIGRGLNKLILGMVIPSVARLRGGLPAARMMDYFWDTVENCVSPDVILTALREAGFGAARRKVTGGILSEYIGISGASL